MIKKLLVLIAGVLFTISAFAQTPVIGPVGLSGVVSINSSTGNFTFTGSGVSCTGTTCTFTGGGGAFTALSGDATSTSTGGATTVKGLNGTQLSALASGILYNTTGTGVPSIATAAQILAGLGTQTANCILSGPASGGNAAPTCRALVTADFPNTLTPTFAALNLGAGGTIASADTGTPTLTWAANSIASNVALSAPSFTGALSGNATTATSALSLLKGTYTDGDMCTYTAAGTLLNCNTAVPLGTVTHTGGSLTAGYVVVGNGSADTKPSTDLDDDQTTANALTYTGIVGLKLTGSGAEAFVGASAPAPVVGTAGGVMAVEGTAPTGISGDDAWYANATNHCVDLLNATTDIGCAAGLGATQTFSGTNTFSAATTTFGVPGTTTGIVKIASSTATGSVSITPASAASAFTATIPAATDTIVELTQTQTLTNKSIAMSELNSGFTAGGIMGAASTTALGMSAYTANAIPKMASTAIAPTASSILDNATDVVSTEPVYSASGSVTLAPTTGIGTGNNTTGLTFTPTYATTARVYRGTCHLVWQQITGISTVTFSVVNTVSPTAEYVTSNTSAGAYLAPYVAANITSTTVTAVTSTISPTASGTNYTTDIYVLGSFTASANTVGIDATSGSAVDTISMQPGSYCTWLP